MINQSLRLGIFPDTWKDALVCPIFKGGDPAFVTNYRPISLLSCLEKVPERIIFKHLYNHLHDNGVLTPLQSGFIPGDSTTNQLTFLYNSFCQTLDSGKEIRVVFCGVSKACVWHKGLLCKLRAAGISGSLRSWFESYLSERRQRVILPGTKSDWNYIYAGVPQGSILGPLLFLLYINDIVKDIQSNIRLFADDTSLFIVVENPDTAAQTLNSDLEKITKWAKDWLVSFTPIKTETLLISRKLIQPAHPPLHMLNKQISEVENHKHLGLYFSNDRPWHTHITYIKEKAWKRINIMRKLTFQLDRKSLEIIYTVSIRPILEYGDEILDNCTQYEKDDLEKVQIEAARIATGTTKLVSIENLYSEIDWETLETRRKKQKLVLFYKMVNYLTPLYLPNLIPSTIAETSPYNLRNANDIRTINTRTTQYYNSFLPSTIREWNTLPEEQRTSATLLSFKAQINQHRTETSPYNLRNANDIRTINTRTTQYYNSFLPSTNREWNTLPEEQRTSATLLSFKAQINQHSTSIPKYYYPGDRQSQILHTRLRSKCSCLNYDIYFRNLTDSPLCSCSDIETSEHYFLQCRRYHLQRHEVLSNISQLCHVSTDVLLFGDISLSNEINSRIFSHVQKFIRDSNRF